MLTRLRFTGLCRGRCMSRKCSRPSLLTILVVASTSAILQAQQVTHVHPTCLTPGQSQRVSLFGSGLTNVTQLWTSFPAKATRATDVAPADGTVVFDLVVDASVPIGIHGMRAVGEVAMSELKLVVIDALPRSVETGNNVATTPQKLSMPLAVSGFILPEETDFYLVDAVAGQKVTIEVVGHRLGTPFDPLVRIVAPDGKELLTHDNDDGFDYDFRFPVTFPVAGPYRIEVRDARYQGGLWPYVLRVGDFPAIRVAYPTAPKEGELVSLLGPNSRDISPILNNAAATLGPSRSLNAAGSQGSAWVTISDEHALVQKELEPNNTLADANPFEVGRSIEGRLEYAGDVDAYHVKLAAQQQLYVRIVTRKLGSPVDSYLRLADPAGNEIASADDQADDDAELNFTSLLKASTPSLSKISTAEEEASSSIDYKPLRLEETTSSGPRSSKSSFHAGHPCRSRWRSIESTSTSPSMSSWAHQPRVSPPALADSNEVHQPPSWF